MDWKCTLDPTAPLKLTIQRKETPEKLEDQKDNNPALVTPEADEPAHSQSLRKQQSCFSHLGAG